MPQTVPRVTPEGDLDDSDTGNRNTRGKRNLHGGDDPLPSHSLKLREAAPAPPVDEDPAHEDVKARTLDLRGISLYPDPGLDEEG